MDADEGHDTYAYDLSTGLGRADSVGWGIFIEDGGADHYAAKAGFGDSSEKSVAGFFDLERHDTYSFPASSSIPADSRPSNGKLFLYPHGGSIRRSIKGCNSGAFLSSHTCNLD